MDRSTDVQGRIARYATAVGVALGIGDDDLVALHRGRAVTPVAAHIAAVVREFDALTASLSADDACAALLREARAGRRSLLAVQALTVLVQSRRGVHLEHDGTAHA